MLRNLMNKHYIYTLVASAILTIALASITIADSANFTRITIGPHVTDGGASFAASWVDYDNDGWLDIFVGNGYGQDNFLYRNEGDGTFTKITAEIIANEGAVASSHCWGDYDNDGDADVYAGRWPNLTNFLFTNNGDGTFTRIETAGDITTDPGFTVNPTWVDIDNDGDLDIYCNNEHESPPFSVANAMYRNDEGIFVKITAGEIVTDVYNSQGMGWSDYDNDGDMDVFVPNAYSGYTASGPSGAQPNNLYRNDGNFNFTKITSGPVVTDLSFSFSPSWGDYDNDGDQDLYVTNSKGPFPNLFYSNNGDGSFTKITAGEIVTNASWTETSSWVDFDNDGDLDLFLTTTVQDFSAPLKNELYENNGDSTFTQITVGDIVNDLGWFWSAAWGDYDRDGDLDVYVGRIQNQDNVLYRNDGNGNNWLNVTCVGVVSNASAIGAKVRLKAAIFGNPVWQLREVTSASGFYTQHAMSAHFGLGDASLIDSMVIEWSSGIVQVLTDVTPNQHMVVEEPCCHIPEVAGDADFNNIVNLLDITYLISFFYKGGPAPVCQARANANGVDPINLLDITYLIAHLYKGGPAPVCPL